MVSLERKTSMAVLEAGSGEGGGAQWVLGKRLEKLTEFHG